MEYKDTYEFVPASGCWEEGGEFYDGDTLVRDVSLYEDETGEILYEDMEGNHYPFTVVIDGTEYRDIHFGPASGVMWGKQSKAVQEVEWLIEPVNGFDFALRPLGFVDYDASGESDNAKAYWDLADLLERHYETRA